MHGQKNIELANY